MNKETQVKIDKTKFYCKVLYWSLVRGDMPKALKAGERLSNLIDDLTIEYWDEGDTETIEQAKEILEKLQ